MDNIHRDLAGSYSGLTPASFAAWLYSSMERLSKAANSVGVLPITLSPI